MSTPISDNAWGYYLLQQYANIAQVDYQAVRINYVASYTEAGVTELGHMGQGLLVDAIKTQFQKIVDQMQDSGQDATSPIRSALYTALMTVGGTPPSTLENIETAAVATVNQVEAVATSAFKGVAVVAVVGGFVYLAFILGWFKVLASKVKPA